MPNCKECRAMVAFENVPPQWVCLNCGCVNWSEEKEMDQVLALDFDGVIHQYSLGWKDGSIYDPPMEGAILGMKTLQHRGWHLIIFTCRVDHTAVHEWLVNWWPTEACLQAHEWSVKTGTGLTVNIHKEPRVKETRICNSHPIPQVTNRKPGAHAYIDDRGFRFETWGGVLSEFGN